MDKAATGVDAGHLRLVLEEGSLFDIDALEAGVLEASYATMWDALAGVLEAASRERALEVCGEKRGSAGWCSTTVTTGWIAKAADA